MSDVIGKKVKEARDLRMKILEMDNAIASTSKKLKDSRFEDKSHRISKIRLSTHNVDIEREKLRRPPDKSNDIRIFTKMDSGNSLAE
jgi:hypothetical protein